MKSQKSLFTWNRSLTLLVVLIACLVLIILANKVQGHSGPNGLEARWSADKTAIDSDTLLADLKAKSARFRREMGQKGIPAATQSWSTDLTVGYDKFTGSSNDPQWQGVQPLTGGSVLFHKDGFTAFLFWRLELTSRCLKPGKKFGATFLQTLQGAKAGSGYRLVRQFTVLLPSPHVAGDMLYEELPTFNSLIAYRKYRDSLAVVTELGPIVAAVNDYERRYGANAWRDEQWENGELITCDPPNIPIAKKDGTEDKHK